MESKKASDLYKELGEVFNRNGLPSRDWEKLAALYNKAEAARGLSYIVDEAIKGIQIFIEAVPMEPNKMASLGDIAADLYDYNQAYKTSVCNQKP